MNKINKSKVGARIKGIRTARGETQTEFAKAINATLPAVSNWETGRNIPNNERLKSIAKIGNITTLELLYGNIDPFYTFEYPKVYFENKLLNYLYNVDSLQSTDMTSNSLSFNEIKDIFIEIANISNQLTAEEKELKNNKKYKEYQKLQQIKWQYWEPIFDILIELFLTNTPDDESSTVYNLIKNNNTSFNEILNIYKSYAKNTDFIDIIEKESNNFLNRLKDNM